MIALLAGGTGAAKLLDGMLQETDSANLTVICNTGDDIALYGLHICPDIDTILYACAGLGDWGRGWGIEDDSFFCLESLRRLGHETWFRLGDRDLATHIHRTLELLGGRTLAEAVDSLRRAFGINARILPMSNDPVETRVVTPRGDLHFQEFFVRDRWEEEVHSVYFKGIHDARPAPGVIAALLESEAVILCPSNPVTSLGPILGVREIREALQRTKAPVLAISPIVGGAPVSGPAHKFMTARGWEVSALGVAKALEDVIDFYVIDARDCQLSQAISAFGIKVFVTETIMVNAEDRRRLGRKVLDILQSERKI